VLHYLQRAPAELTSQVSCTSTALCQLKKADQTAGDENLCKSGLIAYLPSLFVPTSLALFTAKYLGQNARQQQETTFETEIVAYFSS